MDAKRVLVVEDDPDISEMMAEYLSDHCTVRVAEDGARALEMLACQRFDAVVVDLELPGISGASLIGELRRRGLDIPTLMVSGAPDARARAREVHTDFISKPFDVDRFGSKVDELLDLDGDPAAISTGPDRPRRKSAPTAVRMVSGRRWPSARRH